MFTIISRDYTIDMTCDFVILRVAMVPLVGTRRGTGGTTGKRIDPFRGEKGFLPSGRKNSSIETKTNFLSFFLN